MDSQEVRVNAIIDFVTVVMLHVDTHIKQYMSALEEDMGEEFRNLNELVGTFLFGLNICVGNLPNCIKIHRKIMKISEDRMEYVFDNEQHNYKIKEDGEIRKEKQGEAYRVICENIKECYDSREAQLKCLITMMKSDEYKMIDNIEDSISGCITPENLKKLTDRFLSVGESEIIIIKFKESGGVQVL